MQRQTAKNLDLAGYKDDIVAYARDILHVELTPDQEAACRALPRSGRVLLPSGNETGKCESAESVLTLADGSREIAKNLIGRRFKLPSFDGEKIAAAEAYAESNGTKPLLEITTDSGYKLRVTENHPLWAASIWSVSGKTPRISNRGWRNAEALTPDDTLVASPDELNFFGSTPLDLGHVKLLAYMIGDGGMTTCTPTFTQVPGKQLDEFIDCCYSIGCQVSVRSPSEECTVLSKAQQLAIIARPGGTNTLTYLLRSHGLMGKHSRDKFIPEAVFKCPKSQVALFLNRLYSTDGWACSCKKGRREQDPEIGFCSISERLVREVQTLCLRFGIHGRTRYRSNVDAWCFEILSAEDVEKFCEEIGIYGKEDVVAKALRTAIAIVRRDKWRRVGCLPGFRWERVVSVKRLPAADTVAICVPGNENYVDHLLEHNSFCEAVIALHHFDCYNPSLTIVTAPVEKQLTDIVFKELRVLSGDRPGWSPRANTLQDAPNHWIKGYTARNETAFHGRHDAHVLILFDEAEEIAREFWEAAESMADWILAAYNPLKTSSPAAIAERDSRWTILRMDATRHPNVIADLAGQSKPFPANPLDARRVLGRLQSWATPVQEDEPEHPDDLKFGSGRWRLGPVAQARICGIRPTNSTNSVFSESLWCKLLGTKLELETHWPLQIGCDTARQGSDYTAICVRRGACVLQLEKHQGWRPQQVVERLKQLATKYATDREDDKRIPILIDDTGGYGAGITEYGDEFRFIPVNFSWKSDREEEYTDVRSQLWFDLVDIVDANLCDISRVSVELTNDLHDQLITPTYKYDKRQRRQLDPKQLTRDQIGCSPDLADAMVLAFSPTPNFFESYSLLK